LNPGVGCLAGVWGGPVGCGIGTGLATIASGAILMNIIGADDPKTQEREKEQCENDDDCKQKASDWDLKQAGINAHEVKKGLG